MFLFYQDSLSLSLIIVLIYNGIPDLFSQDRVCQGNACYDRSWYARALKILKFRFIVSQLFYVACTHNSQALLPETRKSFSGRLYSQLEGLGCFSTSNVSSDKHARLWRCAFEVADVTLELVCQDITEEFECAWKIADRINNLALKLDDIKESFCNAPSMETIVQETAAILHNQLQWLTVLVRCWMDIVPRKKKKKKKSNVGEEVSWLEEVQKMIKKFSVTLIGLFDTMFEHYVICDSNSIDSDKFTNSCSFVTSKQIADVHVGYAESQMQAMNQLSLTAEKLRDIIKARKY